MTRKKQTDTKHLDLGDLLERYIKQPRTEEQMQEELREVYSTSGKAHLDSHRTREKAKKRNSAGALAKAAKYLPAKQKAKAVYAELKNNLGRNPPWKVFINALERKHPEEWGGKDSKDGGVNGWWKAMNAGKSF